MGYTSNKYSKKISDDELWGLDVVMSEFILPRIKKLREIEGMDSCVLGYPSSTAKPLGTKRTKRENKLWDAIIRGLELNIKNDTEILTTEEEKEMEKGLRLLGKYYSSLWS